VLVLAGTFAFAGCGGNPNTPPPPPPVENPTITCPANVTVDSTTGGPMVVSYPDPVTGGGTPPITTHCTIASGSPFPVGSTDVICTGTDSASRQASCVFQVQVTFTPKLKGTRFLAFGDSITGGEVGTPGLFATHPDQVYPALLMRLMTPRYATQMLTMTNCGQYGEKAINGVDRLRSVLNGGSCGALIPAGARLLATGNFDALLLLEGTNDLNDGTISLSKIREALRTDIRHAKDAGVQQVFLSTLPPEFGLGGDMVPAMNDQIRSLAASEGVVLIDSYAVLGGQSSTLIGIDGIHPTAAGQQLMADAFFAAVKANFEVAPPTGALARIRR
jgi:lysophospholipase L1-like esterase